MGKKIGVIVLSFLFCIASLSYAEDPGPKVPRLFGTFTPSPGVWSEYAIFEKATGVRTTMRMSIVGQEGDSYWYEVVNKEDGKRTIVKMLVKGDPNDPDNIQRLIMKTGNQPAQEMPRDFVLMGRRMAGHMFEKRSGVPMSPTMVLRNEKVGEGTVKVPAGTFEVTKNKVVDSGGKIYAEYRFSKSVLPLGVVSSDTENTSMVLLGYGTGAKSMITEEPAMMTQPPGMPEGMPRGMPPGIGEPPTGMHTPQEMRPGGKIMQGK